MPFKFEKCHTRYYSLYDTDFPLRAVSFYFIFETAPSFKSSTGCLRSAQKCCLFFIYYYILEQTAARAAKPNMRLILSNFPILLHKRFHEFFQPVHSLAKLFIAVAIRNSDIIVISEKAARKHRKRGLIHHFRTKFE